MYTAILALETAIQDKILKDAAETAGKVYLLAYRAACPPAVKAGTYKSAQDTIEHFQHMVDSVGQKTFLFSDKSGAYTVVGIKAAEGNYRPAAPQAEWLEGGTQQRQHADGHPTGEVAARHILEQVVEANTAAAQAAAINLIRIGVQSVLGN